MTESSEQRMKELVKQLKAAPGLAESMGSVEGAVVAAALNGLSVYEIAQGQQISEGAVWDVLARAARQASGQPLSQVEVGGLGSDTDPGVTGGYGDTGFGSLGNEPPEPISEEPNEA